MSAIFSNYSQASSKRAKYKDELEIVGESARYCRYSPANVGTLQNISPTAMEFQMETSRPYSFQERMEIVEAAKILCEMADCVPPTSTAHYHQSTGFLNLQQVSPVNMEFQPIMIPDVNSENRSFSSAKSKLTNYSFQSMKSPKESALKENNFSNSDLVRFGSTDVSQRSLKKKKGNVKSIHSPHFREAAQELLRNSEEFSHVNISERKPALFGLLTLLCPNIRITKSGKKSERSFLYDKTTGKRFRTYGEAIKSGALDKLLLETGSSVLLKSCHRDAEARFNSLVKKKAL